MATYEKPIRTHGKTTLECLRNGLGYYCGDGNLQNYIYIGGLDDGRAKFLYDKYHEVYGKIELVDMPEDECVCGHVIGKRRFVMHKECLKAVRIGCDCIMHFLKSMTATCPRCEVKHRRKTSVYCKECEKTIRIEEERLARENEERLMRENEERLAREREERLARERAEMERMREERLAREAAAKKAKKAEEDARVAEEDRRRERGLCLACGGVKNNPAYDKCWTCASKVIDQCDCGRWKQKKWSTCWNCREVPTKVARATTSYKYKAHSTYH